MVALPLPKGSDPGRYEEINRQRLINCYYEPRDKRNGTIFMVAGTVRFVPVSATLFRGGIECDGIIYGVWGDGAYKVTEGGLTQFLGYVTGSRRVWMAKNGAEIGPPSQAKVSPVFTVQETPKIKVLQAATGFYGLSGTGPATTAQIGIVTDNGDYFLIEQDRLEQVGTSDLPKFISICEIDGYFILIAEDGRFFTTAINNGRIINGLDVASAEGSRDKNVAGVAHRLELWIFGKETTEIWRDVANPEGSPFSRLPGAVLPKGCGAAHSIKEIDNGLAWVGNDFLVYRNDGYAPVRISIFAVERAIQSDPSPRDIEADVWTENGHAFYALTGTDWTWVLDFATMQWHERVSYGQKRWRGRGCIRAFDKNIVGSRDDGALYEMQSDVRKEGNAPLVCKVRAPSFDAFPDPIAYDEINIRIVTGKAAVTGSKIETDPVMTLRWSDDAATFTGTRQISLGKIGQGTKKVRSHMLGSGNPEVPRTWEIEISDPHVVAISGIDINPEARPDGQ
jgi:hypothetical protein